MLLNSFSQGFFDHLFQFDVNSRDEVKTGDTYKNTAEIKTVEKSFVSSGNPAASQAYT